ncbi:MAG: TetR/AcrR family transcriptional regulator [Candidatus Nanohaloarchaea archaeon]|nr:TetR/AcrR family transcriptional regulator [Candidatus Nanohaloarchaea archaeon]
MVSEETTQEKIMQATYRALCSHGYADLSMQKIAEEFDKGKSLLYHHFDDKEDLMISFLDHLVERLEEDMRCLSRDSEDMLDCFLDKGLCIDDSEKWEFRKALFEMRSQAPFNEKFASRFKKIDNSLLEVLEEILEDREVSEPERSAEIVLSIIEGMTSRRIAMQDESDLTGFKNDLKSLISDL